MTEKTTEERKSLNVKLPWPLMEALDRWRGAQPGVPNVNAAINLILQEKLVAGKGGGNSVRKGRAMRAKRAKSVLYNEGTV
jgi:hypothetical protein